MPAQADSLLRAAMGDDREIFELRIEVASSDIDELGHVNNVVYLRWVQEAAVAHWRAVAAPRDQAALRWVVMRHAIDYKRPAFHGDTIIARTWVGTATRSAFNRHTELLREPDGRLLAIALTVWCPIDSKSGRPVRVSPEVRERFSSPEGVDA